MGKGAQERGSTLLGTAVVHELVESHREMLGLCDLMESIADSLPNKMDVRHCVRAASLIQPLLERMHKFEEEVVFPAIAKARPDDANKRVLDRLKVEHCEDECYAEELSDALNRVASGMEPVAPETLGYMLRGFFESMRRHIAFEREHFLLTA